MRAVPLPVAGSGQWMGESVVDGAVLAQAGRQRQPAAPGVYAASQKPIVCGR